MALPHDLNEAASIKRVTTDEARRHARVDLDRLKEMYDTDKDAVAEDAGVTSLSGPELIANIESGEAWTTTSCKCPRSERRRIQYLGTEILASPQQCRRGLRPR
jgi:hypothetical protein